MFFKSPFYRFSRFFRRKRLFFETFSSRNAEKPLEKTWGVPDISEDPCRYPHDTFPYPVLNQCSAPPRNTFVPHVTTKAATAVRGIITTQGINARSAY